MKLLALLHGPPHTGSDTTIRRIAAHLVGYGHSVDLVPEPAEPAELAQLAEAHGAAALIGTHAFFSGRAFLHADLPYVLVFGGTDLNELSEDTESFAVMTRAVEQAAGLVAFNEDFVRRCLALWPQAAGKLRRIPQGVHTRPSRFSLRGQIGLAPDAKLLLLPSGLRPVKDPLFLLSCVRQWHLEDPRIHLVIVGVSYDPDYEEIVRRRCGPGPAARYLGTLPRADLHAAMLESTVVLNTSTSECSPNAVLEAMHLGCRVAVRNIPGNTSVVEHGVTGLVFDDPEDFRRQVQRLLDDEQLGHRLAWRAQRFVRRAHDLRSERVAYADLVDRLDEQAVRPGGARGGRRASSS